VDIYEFYRVKRATKLMRNNGTYTLVLHSIKSQNEATLTL